MCTGKGVAIPAKAHAEREPSVMRNGARSKESPDSQQRSERKLQRKLFFNFKPVAMKKSVRFFFYHTVANKARTCFCFHVRATRS